MSLVGRNEGRAIAFEKSLRQQLNKTLSLPWIFEIAELTQVDSITFLITFTRMEYTKLIALTTLSTLGINHKDANNQLL